MAVLTVQKPTSDAPLAVVYGNASSGGDAFPNTGKERLRVRNNAIPNATQPAPTVVPTLAGATPGASVANPGAAPGLASATTGGAIAAGTYTVGFTWTTANGETQISPTATITTTGSTSTITATVPATPVGATGWNLYIAAVGTTTPLYKQNTAVRTGTTYTQTAAITTATAQPPATNTSGYTNLTAGTYTVAYAWSNGTGDTPLGPSANVTITQGQQINVSGIAALPAGMTFAGVYCSQVAGSGTLLRSGQTGGTTYTIGALPTGTTPAQLSLTVTITGQKHCNQGFLHNGGGTVAAAAEESWGALDPYRFNDAAGNVDITYSTAGSVQVAVVT